MANQWELLYLFAFSKSLTLLDLLSEPAQQCYDTEWYSNLPIVIIAIIVYVLLVPSIMFFMVSHTANVCSYFF